VSPGFSRGAAKRCAAHLPSGGSQVRNKFQPRRGDTPRRPFPREPNEPRGCGHGKAKTCRPDGARQISGRLPQSFALGCKAYRRSAAGVSRLTSPRRVLIDEVVSGIINSAKTPDDARIQIFKPRSGVMHYSPAAERWEKITTTVPSPGGATPFLDNHMIVTLTCASNKCVNSHKLSFPHLTR
jgi:hypothetical protein